MNTSKSMSLSKPQACEIRRKIVRNSTIRDWPKERPCPGPCWGWDMSKNIKGYGLICLDGTGRCFLAHRMSYAAFHSVSLREGLEVDHVCRNTQCVNPDHLEEKTSKENTRASLALENQTHCKAGHLLEEVGVYVKKTKYGTCTTCRACHKLTRQRYETRKRGAA